MRLAWLSDIHLDFLKLEAFDSFIEQIRGYSADALAISGDISQASILSEHLTQLGQSLEIPIYFVLGNHDFYNGSKKSVLDQLSGLCQQQQNLIFLDQCEPIRFNKSTAILGHSCWYDTRCGTVAQSNVALADFRLIADLIDLSKAQRIEIFQRWAADAISHLEVQLPRACEMAERVVLLTHVPPFREAARYQAGICEPDYLPYFCCQVLGDYLRFFMQQRPHNQLHVLCGHTHTAAEVQVLPNLKVSVAAAEYHKPVVQTVFEF